MSSAADQLRAMMTNASPVVAPGAGDPLTVKLIEEAGFAAAHVSGGAIARGLGQPDLGQFGVAELINRVSAIAEVSALPLIVDVDSGFGGPHAFARAIKLLMRVDAAAMHIEDMDVPRRFSDPSRNLVSPEDMVKRIQAGLAVRGSHGPLIIARTDSAPHLGLDAAIDRVNRYLDAGADVGYVEFVRERAAIETIAARIRGPKLIAVTRGETAPFALDELRDMGFCLVVFPADAQLTAIHAMRRVLAHIRTRGTAEGFTEMVDMADRNRLVGTKDAVDFEASFLP